ncbi:MAG TPA: hypothetical protein VE973_02050 [Candidatus Limnocylindria bacterium]|nr:hypothetical protein [Candidatus Limnocylindria bacterium]
MEREPKEIRVEATLQQINNLLREFPNQGGEDAELRKEIARKLSVRDISELHRIVENLKGIKEGRIR